MVAQYKSSQLRDSELPFILSPVPDPAKVLDQDTFIEKDKNYWNKSCKISTFWRNLMKKFI